MSDFAIVNGEKIPRIKCESEETITNMKTGKVYKTQEEAYAEADDKKDIRVDVKIIVQKGFDVFGKKPLK